MKNDAIKEDQIRELKKKFSGMMSALYKEKGASLRIEIMEEPEVSSFIDTHADILDSAFSQADMSDNMRTRLQNSDWIFSGMKTFHELNEAFPSLLDENGNRKPFEQFLNDVQRIDSTYNRHYLNAEYNFAQASAEMAAKWDGFAEDGDEYYLQYRTMMDDKVRPEHASLHGVTLPADDSFWDEYYPPNGWNCRCTVVQVLKSKYGQTDHDEAVRRALEAIPDAKARKMFAFNSGKEQRTFPDYNPYTISKCKNCPLSDINLAAGIPANQLCDACCEVRSILMERSEIMNEYEGYSSEQWIRHLLTKNGYVVVEKDRKPSEHAHPNEIAKYDKELKMCEDLAGMGHCVQLLSENNRTAGTFDIYFDNVPADLKKIEGNGSNIPKSTRHALRGQGAEIVIFCLPSHESAIYERLTEARRKYGSEGKIYFYFNDDMRLREL